MISVGRLQVGISFSERSKFRCSRDQLNLEETENLSFSTKRLYIYFSESLWLCITLEISPHSGKNCHLCMAAYHMNVTNNAFKYSTYRGNSLFNYFRLSVILPEKVRVCLSPLRPSDTFISLISSHQNWMQT